MTHFDGIVKLGDSRRIELFLLDITKVLEELLPSLTEKPGFILTAPI